MVLEFSDEAKAFLVDAIGSIVEAKLAPIQQDLTTVKGTLTEHSRMLNVLIQDVRFIKQDVGQLAADVSSIRNHVQLISHDNILTRDREDRINERLTKLENAMKELKEQQPQK